MKLTKDDILYKFKEKYEGSDYDWAKDFLCEDGSWFHSFDDTDEFYTDMQDYFCPVEYAMRELYTRQRAIEFINERKIFDKLKEYGCDSVFDYLWLGYDYSHEHFDELVKDFVYDDFDDYMEWIMGD